MSNPNASEPEVAVKVDERLSTLSSIARNVTLRLTNQTSTKKGNVPKIVSKNTATNVNRKEPLGNRKKEVLNIKVLSNGDDDLREKNVDLKQIIEEKVVNRNECPESPTQFKEDKLDSASSKMTKIKTSQFVELNTTPVLVLPNSKQNECSKCPKTAEQVTCNCKGLLNAQTNHSKTSSEEQKIIKMKSPVKGSSESKKCSSPKQTTRSQKNSVQGQGSSVKLKIPFEAVRRRKSIKLGRERTFVRKKSFLKKGDGFSARRPLNKTKRTEKDDSLETKATDTGRTRSTTFGKKLNDNRGRISLDEKKDNVNPTFLLGETAGMKYSRKATRDTCSGPIITRKAHSKVPALDNSESTDPPSRRRWSENGVQTYEGMIFSTMFAFSEELKESSDIIHSKLQALYDSTNKSKACSMFSKKSNGRSKEWRQNNRELLDSGSQEIAGTFSNLRKVESNLKTVDQAVSILLKEKSRTKERITGFSKPS